MERKVDAGLMKVRLKRSLLVGVEHGNDPTVDLELQSFSESTFNQGLEEGSFVNRLRAGGARGASPRYEESAGREGQGLFKGARDERDGLDAALGLGEGGQLVSGSSNNGSRERPTHSAPRAREGAREGHDEVPPRRPRQSKEVRLHNPLS